MPSRHTLRLAGVIAIAWFILNLPLLLGVRALPGDSMYEFYPMAYFNVHAIREGLAPWWNPLIFAGYPQIADPQAMLFAPLFMAWMLLRSDPGTTWFLWGALIHVLVGGWSMTAYLRRLGARDFGAIIGALVFMAGGVAASRIQYVPILIAYSLIPLALLVLHAFMRRPRYGLAVALGVVGGSMLAQPVQLVYLTGMMLTAYAVFTGWSARREWPPRGALHAAAGLVIAVVIAGAMAAPQLLFSYAFVALSNRPELPLEVATGMSVSWGSLATFAIPNALQSLRGHYIGPVDPIETFFYIGALPSLMLAFGARSIWRNPSYRGTIIFFGVVAVVATFYMLGGHTPFYAFLYDHLPGIRQFRRPSDSAYLINLPLAVFTGLAASRIELGEKRTVLLPLGLAAVWLLVASLTMRGTGAGWQAATVIAPLVAGALFLWLRRGSRKPAAVAMALVAVILVDYRCFNLNGEFNQRADAGQRYRKEGGAAFLADRLKEDHAAGLAPRVEANGLGATWKNMGVLTDLPATQGYGPLRWVVFDRLYGAYSDGDAPRPTTVFNPDPGSAMNRLLGVRYVLQRAHTGVANWSQSGGVPRRLYSDAKAEVYMLPDALPRVLTPTNASIVDDVAKVDAARFQATDFAREVWLTPRTADERTALSAAIATCQGPLTAGAPEATNVQMTVVTSGAKPGWLVLADMDFPGWVTRIDGQEVPHWRADGLLRAVCVPAGTHNVTARFEPWRMVRNAIRHPEAWR
jgi:hypothetical protein